MDKKITVNFADLIRLAKSLFENVEVVTDITPERSILRLQADYGSYRIFVTELLGGGVRKYRYYVLQNEYITAGFDNAADPRAIRLRYGEIGKDHAGELVPHLHQKNKDLLSLTEEMTFEMFVRWLNDNLKPSDKSPG